MPALAFGVHTGPQNTTVAELRDLWARIEAGPFDWISIFDHFYSAETVARPDCFEAVAIHAALCAATSRVTCGSLVYSVGYRHPAILAKAACTLDHISDGRAAIGIGAGWAEYEYRAYGIPFPPARVRLDQLAEALACIRSLLRNDVTNFDGRYFTLRDARCEPRPVQADLPIYVGGGGEHRTIPLAARYADGWNVPFVDPATYAHKVAVLDAHCARIGRDPAEVEKSVNVALAWSEQSLADQFGAMAPLTRHGALMGTPEAMIEQIRAFQDAGAHRIVLALRAPFDVEGLERFVAEVAPAFR